MEEKKIIAQGKKVSSEPKKKIFFAEDASSVGSYLWNDIMIPAVKNFISNGITGAVNMMLFGKKTTPTQNGIYRNLTPSVGVSYWKPSTSSAPLISQTRDYNYNSILLSSIAEAEEVLDYLGEIMQEYDRVKIADIYEAVGIKPEPSDFEYGWTSMRGFTHVPFENGYLIKAPKPSLLR